MGLKLPPLNNWRMRLFACTWAIAVWFHLLAEPRGTLFTQPVLAIFSVALAVAAALVLVRPMQAWRLFLLCALLPIHAWLEAPVVGNHWVLAALVSLAFCLAAIYAALNSTKSTSVIVKQQAHIWEGFLASARLTLLIAYSFAAFAKLNWGFLDPTVSCAVFYQDHLVNSWALPSLSVVNHPELGRIIAIATIVIEVSVPILLVLRSTRRFGIVLALGFHGLLALDLYQHFWDFSSVLFALFLLFLNDNQVKWLRQQVALLKRYQPSTHYSTHILTLIVMSMAIVVGLLGVLPHTMGLNLIATQIGHSAWWVYGLVVFGAATTAAFFASPYLSNTAISNTAISNASNSIQQRHKLWLTDKRWLSALLLIPPVLAFANGLTPYLEIKTGFG